MAGPTVLPMQVLNQLMDNGLFDTLRKSITAELESNMELKKFTTEEVERSQVLQAPGAERRSRRELFEALRRELQSKVLERASEAAWNAILSKDSVGRQIEEQVETTWWELNGWGTPPERIQPPKEKPAAEKPPVVIEHLAPSLTNASGIGSGRANEQGPDAGGATDQPEAAAQVRLGAGARAAPQEASHSVPEEVQYVPLRMDSDQAPGEVTDGGAPSSNGVSKAEVRTAEGTESIGQSRLLSDAPAEAFGQIGVEAAAVDDPTSVAAEPAMSLEGEATRAVDSVSMRAQDGSEPSLGTQGAIVKQDDPSLIESEQERVGSCLMDGPGGPLGERGETQGQNMGSSVEGKVQEKGDKSGAEQTVQNEVQPSSMETAAPDLEASEVRDLRSGLEGDPDSDVQLLPSIGPEANGDLVPSTGPIEGSATPTLVSSSQTAIVSSPVGADIEMTEATAPADGLNVVEAGQLQTGEGNAEAAADVVHPSEGGKRGVEMEEDQAGKGTEEQGATEAVGQLNGPASSGGAGSEVQVLGGLDGPAGYSNNQEQGVAEIGAAPVGALISEHMIAPQAMEEG